MFVKPKDMLKKIRRTLAIVAFTMVTLLFLDFTGTVQTWFGWMAQVQFLPAVLAINVGVIVALCVLTLVFGRIYCSVICPLGVTQDLIAWVRRRKKKGRNKYTYSKEKRWLRYGVLAVFIAAMIAGVGSLVALLAPYSSFGRICSNLLSPLYDWGNNLLASIAAHYDSYAFYEVDVWVKSVPTLVIASLTLAVLIVLAWRGGRTYCNTICPVGTTLSFLARFSLLKIRFDKEKCRNCSLCTKNCKASCIDFKSHTVDYSRCVVCGNCVAQCKFGALKYGWAFPTKSETTLPGGGEKAFGKQRTTLTGEGETVLEKQKTTMLGGKEKTMEKEDCVRKGRRAFLSVVGLGVVGAALAQEKKKVDGGLAAVEDKEVVARHTPLTPPGSLSASNMAQHCTGCQLCVSTCPNGVLRPSEGLMTLMQPTMGYERGYCRPECTRCSQVCPAGAILPITKEEKTSIQIGHAVWVKKNCVALTDGVSCGNCERHCPTGAIQMIPSVKDDWDSPLIPAINPDKCIGCGACEHLCPARPTAIYVEGHEVHETR